MNKQGQIDKFSLINFYPKKREKVILFKIESQKVNNLTYNNCRTHKS